MPHVLLNAEIMNAQVEVQRSGHADRTQIGRAMRSGLHLMHLRKVRDLAEVCDAAGVDDRRSDVVDQLLLHQLLTVENRVEHLADGDRRRRVPTNETETGLQFGGSGIFQPEKMVRLQAFPEPCRFDRRQSMMRVVQQLHVGPELIAQTLEERRDKIQIAIGVPSVLRREPWLCGFVVKFSAADAVSRLQSWHSGLHSNGVIPEADILGNRGERLVDVFAVGVPVDENGLARRAPEQLIHRHTQRLALNIPERGVDGADRRHRHRPAPPISARIEVLPRVFDAARVAADEQRDDVVAQIARDCQLAAVERRIAQAVDAVLGHDLQRHEVPARAADDDFRVDDLH